MTQEERGWILYDVGNSAFVLIMVTAIMPIFFKDVAASNLSAATSTAYWGYANGLAALMLALLAPILGAFADYQGKKKLLFALFILTGVVFTLLLTLVGHGQWLLCLSLFIFARLGWAGANVFYDAFLPDVTTTSNMDNLSAKGYGYGYIGSVIPFLLVIALILSGGGESLPLFQTRLGFVIVAIWWFCFSLPAMKHLQQHHYLPPSQAPMRQCFARLWETLREIRRNRNIFIFLVAYFFYIDGVSTIITMATAYGRDLGFGQTMLIVVLLVIQIVAFPCAIVFGKLAKKFGTKKMILSGILIYCLITLLAFSLGFIEHLFLKTVLFWCIAIMVASSMGGIQAISRSYFGKLIDPQQSAEFYGFYNVFGKFAAITGPFLVAGVTQLSGDSSWGILAILGLFLIGALLFTRVENR